MPAAKAVVLVTNIPRPYRRALFGVLKPRLAAENLELHVLYTSNPAKHARRGSPLPAVDDPAMEAYVRGIAFRAGYERVVAIPTGLPGVLRSLKPACVLVAGFSADALITACWCHVAKAPLVLWSGAWPGREGDIGHLSILTRKSLVRAADAFVAYGTAAGDYLVSLGASRERIFFGWNTVDIEGIAAAAQSASTRRAELTPKYRLANKNLLYIGTLVESKGLRELVAAALLAGAPVDWALHIVGAGPLRDELEATVRAAGREERFRFYGLQPAAAVAELLGVADGLVLPTKREAWGLVINEAMACGVPVIVSPWAGATRDLVEDGVTGYIVAPDDTARLAAVMSRLVASDPECQAVGRAGAKAVRAKASLEREAEGFTAAMLRAMEIGRDG